MCCWQQPCATTKRGVILNKSVQFPVFVMPFKEIVVSMKKTAKSFLKYIVYRAAYPGANFLQPGNYRRSVVI